MQLVVSGVVPPLAVGNGKVTVTALPLADCIAIGAGQLISSGDADGLVPLSHAAARIHTAARTIREPVFTTSSVP